MTEQSNTILVLGLGNTLLTDEQVGVRVAEAVGRDPGTMWTSVQALVMLSDDADAVAGARSSPFGARMVAGSAAELVDTMGTYAELGFDEFIVPDFNLGPTPEARRESLERLGQVQEPGGRQRRGREVRADQPLPFERTLAAVQAQPAAAG